MPVTIPNKSIKYLTMNSTKGVNALSPIRCGGMELEMMNIKGKIFHVHELEELIIIKIYIQYCTEQCKNSV